MAKGKQTAAIDDVEKKLAMLDRIEQAVRRVTQIIRHFFPVQDQSCPLAGHLTDGGATVTLSNALHELEKLLYPTPTSWNTPFPQRAGQIAAGKLLGSWWQPVYPAIVAIMASHDHVLRHFGLGKWIADTRQNEESNPPAWLADWQAVPAVEPKLLSQLDKSADGLAYLVTEHRAALPARDEVPETSHENNETPKETNETTPTWINANFRANQYKLLKLLWCQEEVPINDICKSIYGREAGNRDRLDKVKDRANAKLSTLDQRFQIEQRRGTIYILSPT